MGLSVDSLGLNGRFAEVTARFEPGSVTAICGPNGAGKSSLLQGIAGLIPADRGEVNWRGSNLTRLSAQHRARTLAYLPQEEPLHWPLTVEALVALGRAPYARPFRGPSDADTRAVNRALEVSDLSGLRDRPCATLSGGEKARVRLARVIATQAPLVLVDEPTAQLDPAQALHVFDILRTEARTGATVIVVTHDLDLAGRADQCLLFHNGTCVGSGRPDAVLTAQNLAQVYGVERTNKGGFARIRHKS